MNFVAILPAIVPLWTGRCLATMHPDFAARTTVVWNSIEDPRSESWPDVDRVISEGTNLGVAASWNRGIDRMEALDSDWLVIVSAACRFGNPGGIDFAAELEARPDSIAVEAGHGIGWHLLGFPRSTIEKVGRFDENFWPAYHEDIDYGRRISLAFDLDTPPWWQKVSVDVAIAGFSHGIDLGGVNVNSARLVNYMAAKWGGEKGDESYTHPFNDEALPVSWWPTPDDPRSLAHGG